MNAITGLTKRERVLSMTLSVLVLASALVELLG